MKTIILSIALLMLAACGPSERVWTVEYRPITAEERQALDEHIRAVLALTRRDMSVSGDDQDLEDIVDSVYRGAAKAICKPRLFEHHGGPQTQETGRFREFTPQPEKSVEGM